MASPTLIDIRNIEWGKSFYWDLYFMSNAEWGINASTYVVPPESPLKFQKWFPASSITEPVFNINVQNINTPFVNFNIPKTLNSADMSIQFYDTVYHEVREWLWEWCMHMFGINFDVNAIPKDYVTTSRLYQGVRPVSECYRPVTLHKYNSDHSISVRRDYLVCPTGSMALQLSSNSAPVDETCVFSVISGMFTRSVTGTYMKIK